MSASPTQTVFVVDDDPDVRKSLARSLEKRGFEVSTFDNGEAFLDAIDENQRGCLVLDLKMPSMNGLEIQRNLKFWDIQIPIIFISGHGDVADSVQALKEGAIDFLEKPFNPQTLVDRIEEAFIQSQRVLAEKEQNRLDVSQLEKLSAREKEVLSLMMNEPTIPSSKELARKLDISHRTVEHHRARMLDKTGLSSIQELCALAKRTETA